MTSSAILLLVLIIVLGVNLVFLLIKLAARKLADSTILLIILVSYSIWYSNINLHGLLLVQLYLFLHAGALIFLLYGPSICDLQIQHVGRLSLLFLLRDDLFIVICMSRRSLLIW